MNDKKLYIPCDDCKFVEDSDNCQYCEFEQTLDTVIRLEIKLELSLARERELQKHNAWLDGVINRKITKWLS